MREIKFRSWDKKRKTMDSWTDQYVAHGEPQVCKHFEDKDCVFMQFIGLKDNNGHDIYEGDILKFKFTPLLEIVKWNGWSFNPFWPCTCGCTKLDNQDFSDLSENFTILGNIYENPELLK